MKLRIVKVDHDGYNGREHHPATTDQGLIVTPLKMEAWWNDPDNLYPGEALVDGDLCADVKKGLDQENHEILWTCVTDDGRTLELMSHEVRIVAPVTELEHWSPILQFVREMADETCSSGDAGDDKRQLEIIQDKAAKLLGRA